MLPGRVKAKYHRHKGRQREGGPTQTYGFRVVSGFRCDSQMNISEEKNNDRLSWLDDLPNRTASRAGIFHISGPSEHFGRAITPVPGW